MYEGLRSWPATPDHERGAFVEACGSYCFYRPAPKHLVVGLTPLLVRLIVTCRNMKGIWEVKNARHKNYIRKKLVLF